MKRFQMASAARACARIFLALALTIQPALAAVPGYINYQARLTNASGVPLEGSQTLTFKFYDSQGSAPFHRSPKPTR